MKFLADESLEGRVVNRLRLDGHEVIYVAEMQPGVNDEDVLAISLGGRACPVDFGQKFWRLGFSATPETQWNLVD
ncbi:MAG: DUF5615 family PIN-like protein [Bryobacteraceae bacterium]